MSSEEGISDKTPERIGHFGGYLTVKECPRCGSKLYDQMISWGGVAPNIIYICGKCGYRGIIALNPSEGREKDKERFEQAVEDMKKIMEPEEKKS